MTGTLGDSALGLKILESPRKKWKGSEAHKKKLIQRHLKPEPRVEAAAWLAQSKYKVTSMIDISDGLTQDLGHILKAGKVGAELLEEQFRSPNPFQSIALSMVYRPRIGSGGRRRL